MNMTSMTPLTSEAARERYAVTSLPHGWQSMSSTELASLSEAMERHGEWPLMELVELELEQRHDAEQERRQQLHDEWLNDYLAEDGRWG